MELTFKEFMHEFRADYSSDKWGHTLSTHFTLCDEMYYRGFDIPEKWKFRPSPLSGDLREKDSYFYEIFDWMSEERLTEIGNFLHRLAGVLEEKYSY